MSIVFSKKEKRARTTSNETNTSFVKNVTSRVSGLLPSTITKWFSSPSSSNANGSTATADVTDSSTEDEATESPVITQPPSKRMRFSTSSKFNHFSSTDGNSTSNIDINDMPVSPFSGSQYQANRNSLTLTPMRSSNEAIIDDKHKDKNEKEAQRYKLKHTISGIGQSVATKRKSIFDKKNEDTKASGKSALNAEKRACFKPSLLGSPFYPGRTMYGGAASSYMNQANIQQHTVALVNETKSTEDSVMSSSARRIMDLLEAYSSPLREARRIPQYPRPTMESFNNSTERFSPYSNKSQSYKTQELHVPSMASILRLKQKSRLMDTTKTARQIIASHSSASSYSMSYPPAAASTPIVPTSKPSQQSETGEEAQNDQSKKMTTKVKTRVTRTSRGIPDQHDIATPVKLPSATLQIDRDKLPTFSFDTPTVPNITVKPSETKRSTEVSTSKPETVTNNSVYKFSNPVRISYDTPDGGTTPKFTFESPDRRIDQNLGSKSVVSSVVGDVKDTNKSTTQPKDWQCPDCWVSNKADVPKCACCGYKQPVKNAKCSVCKIAACSAQKDKCALCEKMASPPLAKATQPSKWKCESCWIMNEDSAGKCVCCGSNKPSEKAGESAKAADVAAFPKVKTPTCGGCFTADNLKESAKTIKSDQAPTSTTTFFGSCSQGDTGFITLAKTQKSEKWECSSCLVRNDSNKSLCVCCGAEREPKNKLPETKFNFGTNTNTTFKFGINPKAQESAITMAPEVTSTPEPKEKQKSEANNNVLAETPTYTFSLPTKKLEIKMNNITDKPETNVKFNFGIPKDANASKSEADKVRPDDNEKAQEVPEVNFAAPVQETAKPTGGLFTSALTSQAEKDKPLLMMSSNLFTRPTTEAKNEDTSKAINVQPVVPNAEKTRPQNTFTLGLKPSSNLFAAPTTASSSINPFTSPAQSITGTTNASTAPIMLPTASNQETKTSSSAPTASATPMFSFGNSSVNNSAVSAASAAVPADKAKFQFTFGSNSSAKPESAPVMLGSNSQLGFKSPFGSASDNVANNTNAFGLNPGSALGSNSALATGTNGLSANNGLQGNGLSTPLGGNTLTGNPLGGNTLTTNSMSGNILGGNTLTGNTFGVNNLTGGNSISSPNALGGTNGLPGAGGGNGLGANNTNNALPTNPLTSGSSIMFGNAVQKENMWNTNNQAAPTTNLFVSNTTSNNLQKPPAFTFGSSTPFNATSPPPAFGNNTPTQNIFGMANQNNNNQPSLFSNPVQNQTPTPIFGSPQPPNNAVSQMGMFGTPNISATPTFGAPNPSMPSFDAPSMPAQAPSFNFGASGQPAVFGFGQQQQQQPPQQAGVYSFGGPPAGTPQVQFNMGTAPNPAGRRLRKAVRRTTPR